MQDPQAVNDLTPARRLCSIRLQINHESKPDCAWAGMSANYRTDFGQYRFHRIEFLFGALQQDFCIFGRTCVQGGDSNV